MTASRRRAQQQLLGRVVAIYSTDPRGQQGWPRGLAHHQATSARFVIIERICHHMSLVFAFAGEKEEGRGDAAPAQKYSAPGLAAIGRQKLGC